MSPERRALAGVVVGWYLDDAGVAAFKVRPKRARAHDCRKPVLVLLFSSLGVGMNAGLLAAVVAMTARSRRQVTFWMFWVYIGLAVMFGICGPAILSYSARTFDRIVCIGFILAALFFVLRAAMHLAYPQYDISDQDQRETARRIRRIQDENQLLTPQETVQAYRQGDLRLFELVARLGRRLAEEETGSLVASLTPDDRQQLRKYLEECPQTEKDWSRDWGYRFLLWSWRVQRRAQGVPRRQVDAEQAQTVHSLCRGAEILRDGISPFPPGARVPDPSLLGWNDGTILKLAQAIREEQAFEQLPILADALEDAGCTNEQILEHLRGPEPHHRSCWCLALILDQAASSNS